MGILGPKSLTSPYRTLCDPKIQFRRIRTSMPKTMPDQAPWTLSKGWKSEHGELPKGFPRTPWTIRFPNMDVIYISMLDKSMPPATNWYALDLKDRTVTFEGTTSLEIVGPGRV